jgi:hypothetical protein
MAAERVYRSGRSKDWLKVKNPKAPAVKREAERWQCAEFASATPVSTMYSRFVLATAFWP